MNHKTLIIIATFAAAPAVLGDVVPITTTADPGGYQTYQTLMGSEGTPVGRARWYTKDNGDALATYWANEALRFTTNLSDDDWRVGLTARNIYGDLPDSYTDFSVDVFINNDFLTNVQLPAVPGEYRTTWFDIGRRSGTTDLKLVWKNDFYVPGVFDANIAFGAVQFGRNVVPAAPTAGLLAVTGLIATRRRR